MGIVIDFKVGATGSLRRFSWRFFLILVINNFKTDDKSNAFTIVKDSDRSRYVNILFQGFKTKITILTKASLIK